VSETPQSFYVARAKRVLDIVGSSLLLLITAPIQVLIAVVIAAGDGRPVFFHQSRVGRGGHIFRLHKFRTMTLGTELISGNYPTQAMVTTVGRTLRRLSLDEIPQLVNILRGEMSFVGPRPALLSQVVRYTAEQHGRHAIRPGLTGLAQIRHRNNAPWSRRIMTDLEYVRCLSMRLDLSILFRTIPAALKGDGQLVGQTAADVDDLGSHDSRSSQIND
jgi:lipopolysaccharide/colanic/teichoic acid biosynthesis glycosyltransferase